MPSLYKALIPISKAYVNAAGYRKVGLKYDDLIIEERRDVEKVRRFGRKGRARQSVTPNDAEWSPFDTAMLSASRAKRYGVHVVRRGAIRDDSCRTAVPVQGCLQSRMP